MKDDKLIGSAKFLVFLEHSSNAADFDSLRRCLLDFIAEFGFDHFLMGDISASSTREKDESILLMFNYPEEWLRRYVDRNYVDHDPVSLKGLHTACPFTWAEALTEFSTQKSRLIMNEAREFGLVSGIGLSLRQPTGKLVGIGFSSSLPDNRHDRVAMNLLRVAAFHFYCSYAELMGRESVAAPQLSEREREVLQWIACGKSKSETATILNVSEASVKRYCESSFRKLDANTLAFAVAKAIQSGLIFPDF